MNRLLRIPKRIVDDLQIIQLVKNWNEVLSAKKKQKHLSKIILRNGVKLESPSEIDLLFLIHEIWIDKIYSPKGYEIRDNDKIIDIGGNIGVFATYAATRAKETKVYSFEPFPDNISFLRKNIELSLLGNIEIFEGAVTDKDSLVSLNISDSWIKHSLSKITSGEGKTIDVKGFSFTDILQQIKHCNLLKLDCEGGEYQILYSCSENVMKNVYKIVGEYHNLNTSDLNGKGLKKFLEMNNYKIDKFQDFGDESGLICARRG